MWQCDGAAAKQFRSQKHRSREEMHADMQTTHSASTSAS